MQPELFIHQFQRTPQPPNIATCLNSYCFQQPFIDAAYALDLSNAQIVHEVNDCRTVEGEEELAVGFVFVGADLGEHFVGGDARGGG